MSFIVTIIISVIIALAFIFSQCYYFIETSKCISLYKNFFKKEDPYRTYSTSINQEYVPQIAKVGSLASDLNNLICEINHYIVKTKGTSDFSIIQNKVERKLNLRFDQSVAKLSFPTYIGLMGTFTGVFLGILMFILGFDGAGNISDDSIKNLLIGVMISMGTSLSGLMMTTINNAKCGEAKKIVEEEKNEFYDFIQTELMPSLDVSMVAALSKLHSTVDKFEPAFDRVIKNFQETFDRCTKAFGVDFERHVRTISGAVNAMGENMDKINKNIKLQDKLISTLKSDEISKGMEKFIEAGEHFNLVTKSIYEFERMRDILLSSTQETINLQEQYNESLSIPLKIVLKINQILDRITTFEEAIKKTGEDLRDRNILGDGLLKRINQHIDAFEKKDFTAVKYLEIADAGLQGMFNTQTKILNEVNNRSKEALENHIKGFENMLKTQMDQIEAQHEEFIDALKEKFGVEEVREEFTNLRRLEAIDEKISEIADKLVLPQKIDDIMKEISNVENQIRMLKSELGSININTSKALIKKGISKIFGFER